MTPASLAQLERAAEQTIACAADMGLNDDLKGTPVPIFVETLGCRKLHIDAGQTRIRV
jgi:hypothetical protein